MAQSSARLIERLAKVVGQPASRQWWDLAQRTHRVALAGDPSDIVHQLTAASSSEPASPLAPAYLLWAGDALRRVARDREAVALYDRTLTAAESAPSFERVDLTSEALRHRAGAAARAGDIDGAISGYRDLAAYDRVLALYRAGVVAERGGRLEQAAALYREVAAPSRTADADDRAQRALRAADRLTSQGTFLPSEVAIADRLEGALSVRDAGELRRLASPTHFAAGPGGGHFRFETEEVLDQLCSDLARSRPKRLHRGLLGKGGKRYLLTEGWRGKWFRHVVGFQFLRCGRGWEWSGVVVNAPAVPWLPRWEPRDKRTNQPLPFPLLAPWPEGRHFTAGGLTQFIEQSAAILAALAIPFVGGAIAAGLTLAFSLSDCGFGLRGFYYNQGPTHSGTDAFAIDFTSYRRGLAFDNISGGTPVLAAADGIVRMTDDDTPSGDSSDANEVQIDHDDPATGTPRFVSRYLHMAGPGMIPVSALMPAPTGVRVGLMNDTGTSVLDHLHFSIHDSAAGPGIGPSVRPTPMDGRNLGDGDSGTCIRSSNRETVVLPPGCAAVVAELFRRLLGRD